MYARILLFVLVLLAPLAHGAVGTTPGGGGGGGGPTNGMTGAQVTNAINGTLVASNKLLLDGDLTVNPSLENWARYLNRGSNATMLGIGDSTGLYTLDYLRGPIEHYLGSNGVMAGHFSPIELTGAYTNLGSASSTNWPGTFYILGTNSVDGPGSLATTNYGTANAGAIWSDTFRAYVGQSPSAGTLMWQTQTNGGAWVNRAIINANGTYGIVATQLVVSPIGWYRSRLVYSNAGPTMVYGLEQLDGTSTGRGARFFDWTISGGVLSSNLAIATNILGPALALMNPAVIFIENRDNGVIYSNTLPALRSLLTNWLPGADMVLVGVGPQQTGDSDLLEQNAVAREWARTNKWTYLDMRALPNYASYFTVTNFYGAGDGTGVHYPDTARRAQATWAMKRLPVLDNAFITGLYVGGAPSLGPPEGGRYFEPRKSTNNLTGNLGIDGFATVGSYLEVSGSFLYGGASSGLVLANRSSPTDAGSRWTFYNSGGTLIHYYGGDIFEQNVSAGNYRFSPTTSGSAASRLGDSGKSWAWLYVTNEMVFGRQTNYGGIRIGSGGDFAISENGAAITGDRGILLFDAGTPTVAVAGRVNFAATGTDAGASSDTTIYRSSAGTLGLGTTLSTPAGSLIASNHTATGAYILQSATGPAGITNGLSAFWNSNGVATYLRSGPTGYTTNKDTVIAVH